MRAAAAAALRLRAGVRPVSELPRLLASERGFAADAGPMKRTPLYDYHVAHGGKMVPFAGWELPIQYKASIMESTKQCRTESVIFDVSHMCGMSLKARPRAAARRRSCCYVCGAASCGATSLVALPVWARAAARASPMRRPARPRIEAD